MDILSYQAMLAKHQLEPSYLDFADKWFSSFVEALVDQHKKKGKTFYVGLNGCQGSGKSTLGDYFVTRLHLEHGLTAVSCSIDDFYLTQSERHDLAKQQHPLLKTRGVPGTHNTDNMHTILKRLSQRDQTVDIPKFDKSIDNPFPKERWPEVKTPVDIVILEGWCWGVQPESEQELGLTINELERAQDADGSWRRFVNEQLSNNYCPLYELMDMWMMLKAPSFDCVFQWRLEQEQKLAASISSSSKNTIMDDQQLHEFIQYYQRLTEHALATLPSQVNFLYEYDGHRNILSCKQPQQLKY